jgi:hypothetical protein
VSELSTRRKSADVEAASMPKEKNYNPVQAQRKADKAKAIKKGTEIFIRLCVELAQPPVPTVFQSLT